MEDDNETITNNDSINLSDDISTVKSFTDIDDCTVINNIKNWEIELIPNNSYVEEKNIPDWFGYMRIDKK